NLIPKELLIETFFYLPFADLVKLCRNSTLFAIICNDEKFWYKRAKEELKMSPEAVDKYFQNIKSIDDLIYKYISKYIGTYVGNFSKEFRARNIDIMNLLRDPLF